LHQVGVLFNLYYDTRKHKSKTVFHIFSCTFKYECRIILTGNFVLSFVTSRFNHNSTSPSFSIIRLDF